MKTQELILDIIGVIAILLSLWAFIFQGFEFYQSTIIGCVGLALFVLKGSAIRKLVIKAIDALIKKIG